jgi:hypothetical protein
VRPNESTAEWRYNPSTGIWQVLSVCFLLCIDIFESYGLPTRSRLVSEFMIGLEKMKAKAGEVSQSACALSLDDMHRLFDHCMNPGQSDADKRRGIIRYVSLHRFSPSHLSDLTAAVKRLATSWHFSCSCV